MLRNAVLTAKHRTHADRYGAKQAALSGSPTPRRAQARHSYVRAAAVEREGTQAWKQWQKGRTEQLQRERRFH